VLLWMDDVSLAPMPPLLLMLLMLMLPLPRRGVLETVLAQARALDLYLIKRALAPTGTAKGLMPCASLCREWE